MSAKQRPFSHEIHFWRGISRQLHAGPLPDVHPELDGFDVRLNSFGRVDINISSDKLNDFLDRHVSDPKVCQWNFSDHEELGN